MANLIENHVVEQSDFTFHRISAQVERVLFSLDFIARHRLGVSLDEVYQSQNERFGTCRRTAKRDLSTMVAAGVILVKTEDRQQVFRLNPSMKLGQLLLSNSAEDNDANKPQLKILRYPTELARLDRKLQDAKRRSQEVNEEIDQLWEAYLDESVRMFPYE
jgi:hypothetical protein